MFHAIVHPILKSVSHGTTDSVVPAGEFLIKIPSVHRLVGNLGNFFGKKWAEMVSFLCFYHPPYGRFKDESHLPPEPVYPVFRPL